MLALLALALVLPAALSAPMIHDSFWISWSWSDQFTDQLGKGVLYPRWLPDANSGTGSAIFYFYPPLAFYLAGVLGLLGLSTYGAIIAAFGLAAFLGGVAAYHWLRGWAAHPLLGAAFYVLGPYHVLDFYGRGALAEFCAMSLLPVIALAIRDRRPLLLAVSYAALIATHLPLALLTSILLIAPGLVIRRRSWWGVPLGIALASAYLVPALALGSYRDTSQLFGPAFLQPSNWTVLGHHPAIHSSAWMVYVGIVAVLAVPALAIALRWRSPWAIYALALCALAGGLVPLFWSLPLVDQVQFPFRALSLAEFALATAIGHSGRLALFLAAVPALAVLAGDYARPPPNTTFPTISEMQRTHPDVRENLALRPLPQWPQNLGLAISLAALLLLGFLARTSPRPARPAPERDGVDPRAADGRHLDVH